MPSFLDEVVDHKKSELKERIERRPLNSFRDGISKATGSFKKALEGDGLKLIAEIKPRSPSLGELDSSNNFDARLDTYQRYAQCVSVLCDQRYFGGSVDLLESVSKKINTPTLLKDFVINPYQIYEGRKAGAEAALLIAKILTKETLIELNSLCKALGMTAVVEVQSEEEIDFVECISPEVILVNNRNLDNLQIDLLTVEKLRPRIDQSCILIAASGIETAADLIAMRPFASRFLVGSALMKTQNPEEKFEEFFQAEKQYLASKQEGITQCR